MRRTVIEGFVPVQWHYDGLGGKVIAWTKAHGNANDDPSHLLYVLAPDGREVAHATGGEAESASSFVKWLAEASKAWEKSRLRGVAHLFEDVAGSEVQDPFAPADRVVVAWVTAVAAEGASPEAKAAAARSDAFAKSVLSSKKLEEPLRACALRKVDAAKPAVEGAPPAAALADVPSIVVIAPAKNDGSPASRVDLEGSAATVDAVLAAVRKAGAAPAGPR